MDFETGPYYPLEFDPLLGRKSEISLVTLGILDTTKLIYFTWRTLSSNTDDQQP